MSKIVLLCLCAAFAVTNSASINIQKNNNKTSPGRITGGELANAGQFPFAAAIYYTTKDGTYFCSGALLSNIFVVTVGHCVQNALDFVVLLGRISLREPSGVYLTTSSYVMHPYYNEETFENDVGLINFRLAIEFTDFISPITLPTDDLAEGTQVTAIGWGATDDETSAPVDRLNFVTLVTLSAQECRATYGDQVPGMVVCVAGEYTEGPCRGDLGAPITISSLNRHVLVGINSFVRAGASCEVPEPAGYTKIISYVDWIKAIAGLQK